MPTPRCDPTPDGRQTPKGGAAHQAVTVTASIIVRPVDRYRTCVSDLERTGALACLETSQSSAVVPVANGASPLDKVRTGREAGAERVGWRSLVKAMGSRESASFESGLICLRRGPNKARYSRLCCDLMNSLETKQRWSTEKGALSGAVTRSFFQSAPTSRYSPHRQTWQPARRGNVAGLRVTWWIISSDALPKSNAPEVGGGDSLSFVPKWAVGVGNLGQRLLQHHLSVASRRPTFARGIESLIANERAGGIPPSAALAA